MNFIRTSAPRDGVLLITLNRPAKRNALNIALLMELADCLNAVEADEGIRAVVVTGDDVAFSAGADLADQSARGQTSIIDPQRMTAWTAIEKFRKPSIAAVNGFALGGGSELVLLMDFAVAGESAVFGYPEINWGMFPGDGATQRLSRLIGQAQALRLILTGERIDAHRAERLGLVTEVVPTETTVERALDLAAIIAGKVPIAAQLAKETVRQVADMPTAPAFHLEQKNLLIAYDSADRKERMESFLTRRSAEPK